MARGYASSPAPRLKLPSKLKRGRPSLRVTGKSAASRDRNRGCTIACKLFFYTEPCIAPWIDLVDADRERRICTAQRAEVGITPIPGCRKGHGPNKASIH